MQRGQKRTRSGGASAPHGATPQRARARRGSGTGGSSKQPSVAAFFKRA